MVFASVSYKAECLPIPFRSSGINGILTRLLSKWEVRTGISSTQGLDTRTSFNDAISERAIATDLTY